MRQRFNGWSINARLMVLLTLLGLLDFQTTKVLVDRHGFAAEGNPLLYSAMVQMNSVYAIFIIKALSLVAFWWLCLQLKRHGKFFTESRMTKIMWALILGFTALCTFNFYCVYQSLTTGHF